ncbi:MAG TPA: DUF4082 domain-containing protein, partial [Methylophilaceae bacterium]|nr:DUF4082 domain-containing protein [Methylophilaceae bacterium]
MEGIGTFIAPSDASTITSLSFYCISCANGDITWKPIIVNPSDLTIVTNGIGSATNLTGADGWQTATFATPPSVTPGTGYVIMMVMSDAANYAYDNIAAYTNYYDDSNSYTTPANPTDAVLNAGNNVWSMYATYTSTGTYPYWVDTGAQSAAANDSTTISPALPTGWAVNDLLLLVIAGRPENATPGAFTVPGWTQQGSTVAVEVGTNDLSVEIWYRIAQSGDTAPTVTPHADYTCTATCTTAGYSGFIAAYRNVNTATPFDVTSATNTAAAAATWTPPSVDTATNFALALTIVATADDNALELSTANVFNTNAGAAGYDTTTGSDHAAALADYVKA